MPTFLTTNGGRSSTGYTSLSLRQMSRVRPTNAGEIDRDRVNDETVGRPYDLLRRLGLGDLGNNNVTISVKITHLFPCHSTHTVATLKRLRANGIIIIQNRHSTKHHLSLR